MLNLGKHTYFYTIGFYDKDGNGIKRDIVAFLDKIEAKLREKDPRVVRSINGDVFRIFLYSRNSKDDDILVVPFGKPITKNKPYAVDSEDPGKLIELESDMFDINCLVYSKRHCLAMYTTNSRGPSQQEFCTYLNSYLFEEDDCVLKMKHVTFERSLVNIRNSNKVTAILVSVDLGDDINNYFKSEMDQTSSLTSALWNMATASKENADGKYLSFSIGLGRSKKTERLNKDSIMTLLEQLNLNSRFIKEIELKYEDNRTEKIETFKLKNVDSFLRGTFTSTESKLSPEFLLNHSADVYLKQREYFTTSVQEFLNGIGKETDEDYELNLDWKEGD
nr:MAG TPA: hypothetical protein [Caudoviricetes sp.]